MTDHHLEGPDLDQIQQANILLSLHEPCEELIAVAIPAEERAEIIKSGLFRPSQDVKIGQWFARVLSVREELWQIIAHCNNAVATPVKNISNKNDWRWLMIGYCAACWLVRLDRFILQDFARHKIIQRKLNQPFTEYRIPAKRFTAIFSHYVDPALALELNDVMVFVAQNQNRVAEMTTDPLVGAMAKNLAEYESWLDPSKRNYLRRSIQFVRHAWRRRAASAKQKSLFAVLESLGRAASEFSIMSNKMVGKQERQEIAAILQPGDVLATRHLFALTNLFLPGTWPHTALYIGTAEQRAAAGININEDVAKRWRGDICTFEALKDGVNLRSLEETLNVDCFVVIRPNLSAQGIKEGIERVLKHEGKRYNFDFDFFRSDRLVCTEVIYRAYDGIENLKFELVERAGRQSLAAEDFLDMALDTNMFETIAIFNGEQTENRIATGQPTVKLLDSSYRSLN